jgi:hypothetical protein
MPELVLVQEKGPHNSLPDARCNEALNALRTYTKSSDSRRKMLVLSVQKTAFEMGESYMANKYLRTLDFIQFIQREANGFFNFQHLVTVTMALEAESGLTAQVGANAEAT